VCMGGLCNHRVDEDSRIVLVSFCVHVISVFLLYYVSLCSFFDPIVLTCCN
jgi:hypothetical protein